MNSVTLCSKLADVLYILNLDKIAFSHDRDKSKTK